MTTVLTIGTFDLFHRGHVQLLARCRALAGPDGRVIVGLNGDDFVERFKGRRPVLSYFDREAPLAACRYVDAVLPNIGGPDARPVIRAALPDIIAIGADWYERDYLGQLGLDVDWLEDWRIRIIYLPYTDGISTTAIRGRIE